MKCLEGRWPRWWAKMRSSLTFHTSSDRSSPALKRSQIGFHKHRDPLSGRWETRQVTLSPFTCCCAVLFRSSSVGNRSMRIHPTAIMRNSLWTSSVSASWQQTEFKMQNALWKSDKVKRKKKKEEKKAVFLFQKEKRKQFSVFKWNILHYPILSQIQGKSVPVK